MNKVSETIFGKVLVLDWDGVIDLLSDERYAKALGKIDYKTTNEYTEKINREYNEADKSSRESFDYAEKRKAEKMYEHYQLKDKYLLERNDAKLMVRYHKAIKEIAKSIINSELKDENFDDLVEILKEAFPLKDKYMIGRYVGLLLRLKKEIIPQVDEIMRTDFVDEDRDELIGIMTDFALREYINNPDRPLEVYGKVPYRQIIRGISEESEEQVRTIARSGRYELNIIGSHYNVKIESSRKAKIIHNLFSQDGVMFIPIPFYPTILKDGLTDDEINNLRMELKAFDIDLDQENKPTSKIDYVRYYLYKYYNKFIDDPSQITLIDNSSRNISDCNEKGGIGIYFKLGTTSLREVGSLDFDEVVNAENNIVKGRGK